MTPLSTKCIQTRAYTLFHALENKLYAKTNYLFDLSYLTALTLKGEKALDFLQGQISSDVRKVSSTSTIPGAQCNLKGRILTLMQVVSWQGLHLIIPKDLLEKTQLSLEKTALLSRVSLCEQNQFRLFGFYLQNPQDVMPVHTSFPNDLNAQVSTPHHCFYHLGNGLYVFIVFAEQAEEFCKSFIDTDRFLGSLDWHTLMLRHHRIEIYPESRGLFLPHRLNLHLTDYFAFDKGCYKGQEIIARMHYRATIKHDLKLLTIKTVNSLFVGQKLMSDGAEVGEVVDYSYLAKDEYLLAASILKEAPQWVMFEGHKNSVPIHLLD